MQTSDILKAWWAILNGRRPSLSIEITRECPLRCPGCYAYNDQHLGDGRSLRDLTDVKGEALIAGVLRLVEQHRPLHLSIVGGDPLVRYRELEAMIPQLLSRGVHVQIVTSAFRPLPTQWASEQRLDVCVSVDGLEADHDLRRAPATYARILKNIAGQRITVHCTITAQMMEREGYLEEFAAFWSRRPEVKRMWFSLFTPQRGEHLPEILSREQRERAVRDLAAVRHKSRQVAMPDAVLRGYLSPPQSPDECIFARTTATVSADLRTAITPCQFGGDPDCAQCGCMASAALSAVGAHRLGGVVPVASVFAASSRLGTLMGRPPRRDPQPVFPILP